MVINDGMEKSTGTTFLNKKSHIYQLRLVVRRELGIVARIALVFSRRGLDFVSLNYVPLEQHHRAGVEVVFHGDEVQERLVYNDLVKLIDVEVCHVNDMQNFAVVNGESANNYLSSMERV